MATGKMVVGCGVKHLVLVVGAGAEGLSAPDAGDAPVAERRLHRRRRGTATHQR